MKVSLLFFLPLLELIHDSTLPQFDAGPIGSAGDHMRADWGGEKEKPQDQAFLQTGR